MASFAECLKTGVAGEALIARWFIRQGYSVLPAYEVNTRGKGPRLFTPNGELIAPDMFIFNDSTAAWIEAKNKTGFTWHRVSRTWQTGIDYHCWTDYLRLEMSDSWDVWIMFIQMPMDEPGAPPPGLYGNSARALSSSIHHRGRNEKGGAMVYWTVDSLQFHATLDELHCAS